MEEEDNNINYDDLIDSPLKDRGQMNQNYEIDQSSKLQQIQIPQAPVYNLMKPINNLLQNPLQSAINNQQFTQQNISQMQQHNLHFKQNIMPTQIQGKLDNPPFIAPLPPQQRQFPITQPGDTRYFIIKNKDKIFIDLLNDKNICLIKKSFEKLEKTLQQFELIILIFSNVDTRQFLGYAKMISQPDDISNINDQLDRSIDLNSYNLYTKIEWQSKMPVAYDYFREIKNSWNSDNVVNYSKDCQEVEPSCAQRVLEILKFPPYIVKEPQPFNSKNFGPQLNNNEQKPLLPAPKPIFGQLPMMNPFMNPMLMQQMYMQQIMYQQQALQMQKQQEELEESGSSSSNSKDSRSNSGENQVSSSHSRSKSNDNWKKKKESNKKSDSSNSVSVKNNNISNSISKSKKSSSKSSSNIKQVKKNDDSDQDNDDPKYFSDESEKEDKQEKISRSRNASSSDLQNKKSKNQNNYDEAEIDSDIEDWGQPKKNQNKKYSSSKSISKKYPYKSKSPEKHKKRDKSRERKKTFSRDSREKKQKKKYNRSQSRSRSRSRSKGRKLSKNNKYSNNRYDSRPISTNRRSRDKYIDRDSKNYRDSKKQYKDTIKQKKYRRKSSKEYEKNSKSLLRSKKSSKDNEKSKSLQRSKSKDEINKQAKEDDKNEEILEKSEPIPVTFVKNLLVKQNMKKQIHLKKGQIQVEMINPIQQQVQIQIQKKDCKPLIIDRIIKKN